jgi:ABC-2 type transport system ATP-binding protein
LPEKKIIKEYSKGMKMKLSIASALACRAKLLILDEATSGLDPIVRSEIIDIFLEHIQNGQNSILFSTHITSDLDRIADYITFIHEGKIVFSEAKDAMLDSYAILKCEEKEFRRLDSNDIVGVRKNMFGYEVLTDRKNEVLRRQPGIVYEKALIEDIMLFYTKEDVR